MILGKIKKYLADTGYASFSEMASALQVDEASLEEGLRFWTEKGKIKTSSTCSDTSSCETKGCRGCPVIEEKDDSRSIVPKTLYIWQD